MYGKPTSKPCSDCGGERTGKASICRACLAKRSREWRNKNPEKQKAACYRWRTNNVERWKAFNRKHDLAAYGMTPESYQAMLKGQNYSCAICKTTTPKGPGKKFVVDHCHKTKAVRGLLCCHCNAMLGHAFDDPIRLIKACDYLKGGSNLR